MKELSNVAAALFDVVGSRGGPRGPRHQTLVAAVEHVNTQVRATDPLRFTVGDELQGIYPTVAAALHAAYLLRLTTAPVVDLRVGIGFGDVVMVDEERGIQDGSAWWLAREAVEAVRDQAADPGYRGARTAIAGINDPLLRTTVGLIDAHLARLRGGTLGTVAGMFEGLSNMEIAQREGISESANSQRVTNNDLRPLADAIRAVTAPPP